MSAATPGLVREWLERLGSEWVDLSESIDTFPELRDAITPPTFGLEVAEGAVDGDPATGYLEAGVEAFLVPPGSGPPVIEADEALPDLNRYGHIDLSLDTEANELRLSILDLPPVVQTGGLGTVVVAQLAYLGRNLGLSSVHLEAGKIGRWAWLRCGFDFDWPEQRDMLVSAAGWAAERLGRDVDLSGIRHAWDFADLEGTVSQRELVEAFGVGLAPTDRPIPVGKALILGPREAVNPWWGRLDLRRGSEGYVRLREYVANRARSEQAADQENA
jgi:hypothetical protein